MTRRSVIAAGVFSRLTSRLASQTQDRDLPLRRFEPRSFLSAPLTPIHKARFPIVDIHAHLGFAAESAHGVPLSAARNFLDTPEALISVMDGKNIRTLVNLTGGFAGGLEESVRRYDRAYPGRFLSFTEPWYSRASEPGYARFQAAEIERAKAAGARGLKVLKTLGLYLRDGGPQGELVPIDDRRFDPMWEACGALGLPVAIHSADPAAFFEPIDRHNERFEELVNHPDWSFHGGFPSKRDLLEARNRVFARHPRTNFIGLHVANSAEDLGYASETLDRHANLAVEFGARIGELGRQPCASRRFFERHQDRILFGTDATPRGFQYPQQLFGERLYEIYIRFLETEDEYFDYAPASIPPQGRWKIYGLGLPEEVLRKVYHANAERLLGFSS